MLLQKFLHSDIYNEPYVFAKIGHDGSEIVWPELPEPHCRRAFHIQELIDAALSLRIALVEIEGNPATLAASQLVTDCQIFPNYHERMEQYMNSYSGLILGDRLNGHGMHMVAWDHDEQKVYDPDGDVMSFEELGLAIHSFYAGIQIS